MQASADDDQLVDLHSIVLNAVFYMLDTGGLFGFIRPRVVYKFQGIAHASFN